MYARRVFTRYIGRYDVTHNDLKTARFTSINRDFCSSLKIRRFAKESKLDKVKEIKTNREKERNGEGMRRDGGQRFLISGALFL